MLVAKLATGVFTLLFATCLQAAIMHGGVENALWTTAGGLGFVGAVRIGFLEHAARKKEMRDNGIKENEEIQYTLAEIQADTIRDFQSARAYISNLGKPKDENEGL